MALRNNKTDGNYIPKHLPDNNGVSARRESGGQNFLTGALIISLAGLVVKVISMLFRIPLTNLVGGTGMGYYGVAYSVYNFMITIAASGLSVAISKIVAESVSTGKHKDVKTVIKVAFSTFIVIGAVLTLIVFFFSKPIAVLMKNTQVDIILKAVAPAILIVSVTSVIKGYFQGYANMIPTSIANLIEVFGKLAFGLGIASFMQSKGFDLPYVVAGAVGGVTLGSLLALIYLIIRILADRNRKTNKYASDLQGDTYKQMMKRFMILLIPIAIGSLTSTLANLIDTGMVFDRLQTISWIDEERANYLFGLYSSYAETVFNVPVTVLLTICVPVIPAISSAFALKDAEKVNHTVNSSMKLCMLFAMPCAVGLCVLAEPVLDLLYHNPEEVSKAAELLMVMAPSIIFVCASQLITPILQAIGKTYIPVINIFIASIVKIVLNYFLIADPRLNIMGAIISNIIMYLVLLALNFLSMRRYLTIKLNLVDIFLKPAIGALACGAAAYGCHYFTSGLLGGKVATLLSVAVAAVVYFVIVFSLRILTKEDVEMLPKGKKIQKVLEKLHWVR